MAYFTTSTMGARRTVGGSGIRRTADRPVVVLTRGRFESHFRADNAILGTGVYPATPKEAGWGVTYGGFGLTGQVICIAMFIIYAGAHERVKRAHYETCTPPHHPSTAPPAPGPTRMPRSLVPTRSTDGTRPLALSLSRLALPQSGTRTTSSWSSTSRCSGMGPSFGCGRSRLVSAATSPAHPGLPSHLYLPLEPASAVIPYAFDRLVYRILYRGTKPFALARVFFWGKPGKFPDVVTLQFENSISDKGVKPMNYMEGHYLYLQCPHIEGKNRLLKQWHPFTISSAPDEPYLEIAIRVCPSEHSWTYQMTKYLLMYDPTNSGAVEFVSRSTTTGDVTLGKIEGADGLPFFHVDGPHGAPSQHVFCYNTAIIVGAGIGVTPCSSIMRGIVNYRWKKGFSPNTLYFFWVARLSDLALFKWLIVMLPELKAKELVHNEYYGGDTTRTDGIHARLEQLKKTTGAGTPVPPPALAPGWTETRTPAGEVYYVNETTGQTAWQAPLGVAPSPTEIEAELRQLQAALREAATNQRRLEITLYLTGAKAGDIAYTDGAQPGSTEQLINGMLETKDPSTGVPYIHLKAGRPDWPSEFKSIAQTHGREDIGVVFCGAPMIAAQLKENCEKYSSKEGTLFRLHKENF